MDNVQVGQYLSCLSYSDSDNVLVGQCLTCLSYSNSNSDNVQVGQCLSHPNSDNLIQAVQVGECPSQTISELQMVCMTQTRTTYLGQTISMLDLDNLSCLDNVQVENFLSAGGGGDLDNV